MFTSRRIPVLMTIIAASAVALAGCGGDDDGGTSDNGDGKTGTAINDGGENQQAKNLFITKCGGCHTLSDTGTQGAVGPVLDDTSLDADGIAKVIEEGKGSMPPNLLEGEERDLVAEYIASVSQ